MHDTPDFQRQRTSMCISRRISPLRNLSAAFVSCCAYAASSHDQKCDLHGAPKSKMTSADHSNASWVLIDVGSISCWAQSHVSNCSS